MDDDYELVPKDLISTLRAENKQLKEQLNISSTKTQAETKNDFSKLLEEMKNSFVQESKAERDLLLKGLNNIEDLNKKTLDNLISKTDSHDKKFDIVIESFGELIDSVSQITEEISSNFESLKSLSEMLKKEDTNSLDSDSDKINLMVEKLEDIDLFMKNLRVLLSYVKANDLKMKDNDYI